MDMDITNKEEVGEKEIDNVNTDKEISADGDKSENDNNRTEIKLSPSDYEASESDEDVAQWVDALEAQIKNENDFDSDNGNLSNIDNMSVSSIDSSEEDDHEETDGGNENKNKGSDAEEQSLSPKSKRSRGRPRQPRRLKVPDGAPEDYTSEEEEDGRLKPELRPGFGYPVEFKMKVLKYSDTHSTRATAEKYGLAPKRVREWKALRDRIEAESKGRSIRRQRSDGFTVEQKLQAVKLAVEHSVDEAILIYNIDKRTLEKWRANREQLEARVLRGEGKRLREKGSGRKPKYTQIEESLRDWIIVLRSKEIPVTHKMILNKAKALMEADPKLQDLPVPNSWCWVRGFLKRQNLEGQLGNSTPQDSTENSSVLINEDVESSDGHNALRLDNDVSRSSSGSSNEENEKNNEVQVKEEIEENYDRLRSRRKIYSSTKYEDQHKQRLDLSDVSHDNTCEEDENHVLKPELRPGFGYPVEYKLKVLKYADTHSTADTAEKFGISAKRIREWKSSRTKIEKQCKEGMSGHPGSDRFSVEQNLQAVALSTERSIDEARLLYNVDRKSVGKWTANKAELQDRMKRGRGVSEKSSGRKPKYTQIEEDLRDWIVSLRLKNIPVNQKMVLKKAKILIEADSSLQDTPGPKTWCWVTGFLKRQKLHGLLGSSPSPNHEKKVLPNSEKDTDRSENENGNVTKDLGDDNDLSHQSDDDNMSPSWNGSSDEDYVVNEKRKSKGSRKRKRSSPKPKRPRGRPKQPRRLNDNCTSEEEEGDLKPVLRPGSGYPVEFKMRVLKYAENHSSTATAEKFGLQPVRVRDWKRAKYRIEEESKGCLKRRPRSDGFTVEEKLEAVAFATERSIDEARLLYNVDRNTIGKWKAKKEQLEARLLRGEGNFIRELGSGRKPKYTPIEESLRDWVVALRLKGITLNYKMILNKAKNLMEENPKMRGVPFPRTWCWVTGFLKRHNLHGLLGNTLGREDPRELLNVELKTSEVDPKELAEKIVEIPENPNKRNRRTISLEDKVNIIRRIEQGETQGNVAKSLKLATSTIQTIWTCRNDILHKYVNPKSKTKSDILVWKAYSPIGAALQDWLEQNLSKSVKVTGIGLMEKAIQLSETYRLPGFNTEAKQWLKIFCKKYKMLEIIPELKDINVPALNTVSSSTSVVNINSATEVVQNCIDSNNHQHDDEFHADFHFSDYTASKQDEPQNPLEQQTSQNISSPQIVTTHHLQNHQAFSSENLNIQRFSTTCSTDIRSAITTQDAIKYYNLLRNWIHANYGPHDEILSSNLSTVETTILKQPQTESSYASSYSQ